MLVGKLTHGNSDKFFDSLSPGLYFEVTQNFSHDEIIGLCEENGIEAEYCAPGSQEYRRYGSFAYKVTSENLEPLIEHTLQTLKADPDRTIVVQKGKVYGDVIKDAKKIVYSDKPRTIACRRKVLNKMISCGLVTLMKYERKKNDRWYFYQATNINFNNEGFSLGK